MFKLDSAAVKTLKKPALWIVIILSSIFVWGLAFYWASQTPSYAILRIWVGAEETLDEELSQDIKNYCLQNGLKKCDIVSYNPLDGYYSAAFALRSHNVDVYVLHNDEALAVAETGLFMPLDKGGDGALVYKDKVIGVRYVADYYVLINASSRKDVNILYGVVDKISAYGAKTV